MQSRLYLDRRNDLWNESGVIGSAPQFFFHTFQNINAYDLSILCSVCTVIFDRVVDHNNYNYLLSKSLVVPHHWKLMVMLVQDP